jgi:RimJ/RimL family protein N-acetyltransferase
MSGRCLAMTLGPTRNAPMDPRPTTLTGRLVRLEPVTLEHAPDLLAALLVDPSIYRYRNMLPPSTLDAMREHIAGELEAQSLGEIVVFAQMEMATNRAVGETTYMDIHRRDRGLEIGATWLGKPWQRSGMNTEAKYLLLRHAFEMLGAVRVQLKTDARNRQSRTAIERLGARQEATLRKHMLMPDGFLRDSVLYSILDDEWPAVKASLEAKLAAHGVPPPPS